jgi:hypothetical protein
MPTARTRRSPVSCPYLDSAKWGLLAVTLIGIGVMLWARIDDRRKGLR